MDPIGTIPQPAVLNQFPGVEQGVFGVLLNLVFDLMIVAGGIYALFNFLLAGYAFLSAGDDSKQIQAAWGKIYQSVIGLLVLTGSFVLAAIFGKLLFGSFDALLKPVIPTI